MIPQIGPRVHRIERHNLDEVVSFLPLSSLVTHKQYWPDGPPKHCTEKRNAKGELVGYETTRRHEIKNQEAAGASHYCGRMDIVIWREEKKAKCQDCGHEHDCFGRQRIVEPGPNGTLRGDFALLSPEDFAWAREESRKCWEAAQSEPFLKATLER